MVSSADPRPGHSSRADGCPIDLPSPPGQGHLCGSTIWGVWTGPPLSPQLKGHRPGPCCGSSHVHQVASSPAPSAVAVDEGRTVLLWLPPVGRPFPDCRVQPASDLSTLPCVLIRCRSLLPVHVPPLVFVVPVLHCCPPPCVMYFAPMLIGAVGNHPRTSWSRCVC